MNRVRDLKNDPDERLAERIAARVYVRLGCASVPVLKRAIADALREDKAEQAKINQQLMEQRHDEGAA